MISKAYLKELLGSVSLRIPVENSIVLRECLLGINIYMYLSYSVSRICYSTVQPFKSNWRWATVEGSIEEFSKLV